MDITRPPQSRAAAHRQFQRAYKACIPCRQRKAKCDLGSGPNGLPLGPPCAKCRREQRQCVFSEKRAWERRKTSDTSDQHRGSSSQRRPHRSPHVDRPGVRASSSASPAPNLHGNPSDDLQEESPSIDGTVYTQLANHGENCHKRHQPTSTSLASSMMRTVVSSGNDALNILFDAAIADEHDNDSDNSHDYVNHRQPLQLRGQGTQKAKALISDRTTSKSAVACATNAIVCGPLELSGSTKEVLSMWEACRFIKMGWFTASEAITYIDLFFKNMSPLSPILTDFYSEHKNHHLLVRDEPILCCTMLMISSRYHVLPGAGGASRSFFIHHRLWQHCAHLIMRLIFGQEKSYKSNTRTPGTIEALLLMSEWHPRSLHFPPESDGWDSDLILTIPEPTDTTASNASSSSSSKWLDDVIEPARRSDRMSWMLLGCALSLAHELGIFEGEGDRTVGATTDNEIQKGLSEQTSFRRKRIQRLLYVYINQLASRIGCMSLMPQSLNHTIMEHLWRPRPDESRDEWSTFMESWMDLTKLAKSVTDSFFPSASFAKQQLHSGRYIGLLDHFRALLGQWRERHLQSRVLKKAFYNILFIEYHFVRVYTNSIGMQAVVERFLADASSDNIMGDLRTTSIEPIDYEFLQEVIDGCCQILQKVSDPAMADSLRFSPVRIFLRVTGASIFLLKALSLGVRNAKLQESLDILDKSIQALRLNTLDDIHLASRYATLLEMHVSRLRHNFAASSKTTRTSRDTTRPSSLGPQQWGTNREGPGHAAPVHGISDTSLVPSLNDMPADDWLFLPFDPSMAPFGTGGGQFSGIEDGALDFIWNLPH